MAKNQMKSMGFEVAKIYYKVICGLGIFLEKESPTKECPIVLVVYTFKDLPKNLEESCLSHLIEFLEIIYQTFLVQCNITWLIPNDLRRIYFKIGHNYQELEQFVCYFILRLHEM